MRRSNGRIIKEWGKVKTEENLPWEIFCCCARNHGSSATNCCDSTTGVMQAACGCRRGYNAWHPPAESTVCAGFSGLGRLRINYSPSATDGRKLLFTDHRLRVCPFVCGGVKTLKHKSGTRKLHVLFTLSRNKIVTARGSDGSIVFSIVNKLLTR